MNIDFERLKRELLDVPIDAASIITYNSRRYYLDLEAGQGPAGEYYTSTAYDGADIYVWDAVPEIFRKSVAFHEIVEADLYIHQHVSKRKAHLKATEADRRFASETLDHKTFLEYEEFRERETLKENKSK